MKSERKHDDEWPSLRFARLDSKSPRVVADFILWLCGWRAWQESPEDDAASLPSPEQLVELIWGWDGAPRKRMGKLLWQLLVGNDDPQYFQQYFTADADYIAAQIAQLIERLMPIQQNLNWILEARTQRELEDTSIGQGSWGEDWWLPSDQAAYLRQQIRRARPDLIEESSSYEDCMECTSIPYLEIASEDPARTYTGSLHERFRYYVEIIDSDGKRFPLAYPRYPYRMRPGTGFSWGYGGHGPSSLAVSILADALGGDYQIADRHREEFVSNILMGMQQDVPFAISRVEVLAWLESRGVGVRELRDAEARVLELKKVNGLMIGEFKAQMERIRKKGGLVAQRFDLVPPDFECALYLDLMRNLERAGWVLRCSHCMHPLSCPRTSTGNRQRARWLAGKPVYHEECFVKHRLEHKRSYWRERVKSPTFRKNERDRARNRRKRS